ncbi:hypothetical protein HDV05_003720 [Chytridiales sp. JEL 0842]|nr:hypothetical protein HDV05_003720 [Chytridiales sp. JEL 0842]
MFTTPPPFALSRSSSPGSSVNSTPSTSLHSIPTAVNSAPSKPQIPPRPRTADRPSSSSAGSSSSTRNSRQGSSHNGSAPQPSYILTNNTGTRDHHGNGVVRQASNSSAVSEPFVPPMGLSIGALLNGPEYSHRIGPYVVGKTLGVGSTGRVKLAHHVDTNQKVAIKIIDKEAMLGTTDYSDIPADIRAAKIHRKMEREIAIMKLIQHPSVMQLYDVYESDENLYLILEHVEGGELFDYIVSKGRLSEPEALTFFQQIIAGVEYCHRHLIVHRDLKPENLLLDSKKNVKVADFGLASLQISGKMLETSCGSPHYASPEIIKGLKYDGAMSDIWSCGVILYALLAGNLPFDDENIRRLLAKVKEGIYFIPDHISPLAKDLIRRMLTVDPKKRITMTEIIRHPWFNSIKPKNPEVHRILLTHAADVGPPVVINFQLCSPDDIDREILKSMDLLGWDIDDELIAALMSSEQNTPKVFYHLLLQRKMESLENFDIQRQHEYEFEGGPRRRAESFTTLQMGTAVGSPGISRLDLFKSDASLLRQNSNGSTNYLSVTTPTRDSCAIRSADELRSPISHGYGAFVKSAEELSVSEHEATSAGGSPTSAKKMIAGDARLKVAATHVRVTSPLATNVDNFDNVESKRSSVSSEEYNIQSPADNSMESGPKNKILQENGTSLPPGSPSTTKKVPVSAEATETSPVPIKFKIPRKKPNYDDIKLQSAAVTNGIESSPIPEKLTITTQRATSSSSETATDTTPTEHNPHATSKFFSLGRKKTESRPTSAPTPTFTSPKKSWFANIFTFKPEAFEVYSKKEKTFQETIETVVEGFDQLNIKYQVRNEGAFKCKMNVDGAFMEDAQVGSSEASSPSASSSIPSQAISATQSSKVIKFKVDVTSAEDSREYEKVESPSRKGNEPLNFTPPPCMPPKKKWKIRFVHQQGAFSAFQKVVSHFKSLFEKE